MLRSQRTFVLLATSAQQAPAQSSRKLALLALTSLMRVNGNVSTAQLASSAWVQLSIPFHAQPVTSAQRVMLLTLRLPLTSPSHAPRALMVL